MTNLEDEFKNRFKDEKVTEGIDGDALWDSVSSALDSSDSPVAGWSATNIGLALLSAFIIGSGIVYYFNVDDSRIAIQEQIIVDDASAKNIEHHLVLNDNRVSAEGLENINSTRNDENNQTFEVYTTDDDSNIISKEPNEIRLTVDMVHNTRNDVANRSENGTINSTRNSDEKNEIARKRNYSKTGNVIGSESVYADASSKSIYTNLNNSKTVTDERERISAKKDMRSDGYKNDQSGLNEKSTNDSYPVVKSTSASISEHKGENTKNAISTKQSAKGTLVSHFDVAHEVSVNEISTIPTLGVNSSSRQNNFKAQMRIIEDGNNFVIKRPLPIEIGFFTGLNTFSNQYNDGDTRVSAIELRKSQKQQYGNSSTLMIYYTLKNNVSIGSGIEYNVLKNQFNLTRERLIEESIGTQLVDIIIDPQSGDSSFVYEEQFAESMEIRKVRHNNSLKFISIPLDLSKKYATKKFNYGFGLGLRFNFIQSQSGKLINQEDVIAVYDGVGNSDQLYSKSFLSYHAHAYIEKAVSNVFKIRFNPSIRLQQHGMSNLHGLRNNTLLFGAQLGMIYSF